MSKTRAVEKDSLRGAAAIGPGECESGTAGRRLGAPAMSGLGGGSSSQAQDPGAAQVKPRRQGALRSDGDEPVRATRSASLVEPWAFSLLSGRGGCHLPPPSAMLWCCPRPHRRWQQALGGKELPEEAAEEALGSRGKGKAEQSKCCSAAEIPPIPRGLDSALAPLQSPMLPPVTVDTTLSPNSSRLFFTVAPLCPRDSCLDRHHGGWTKCPAAVIAWIGANAGTGHQHLEDTTGEARQPRLAGTSTPRLCPSGASQGSDLQLTGKLTLSLSLPFSGHPSRRRLSPFRSGLSPACPLVPHSNAQVGRSPGHVLAEMVKSMSKRRSRGDEMRQDVATPGKHRGTGYAAIPGLECRTPGRPKKHVQDSRFCQLSSAKIEAFAPANLRLTTAV